MNLNFLGYLTNYTQFSKYILIGIFTFFIYYMGLWIFFDYFGLFYIYAVSIAYLVSIFFHYSINKIYTFNVKKPTNALNIFKYLFVAFFNYTIQILIIKILFEHININFYLSTFLAAIFTMFSGFFLMNFWVFKKDKL